MEAAKSTDVLSFVMPKLLALAEDDRKRQLGVMRTLTEYIHSGRSVSVTAEKLHIHRNTVNYRVGKALEYLGVTIEDTKAFEQIAASLRILEYLDQAYYINM